MVFVVTTSFKGQGQSHPSDAAGSLRHSQQRRTLLNVMDRGHQGAVVCMQSRHCPTAGPMHHVLLLLQVFVSARTRPHYLLDTGPIDSHTDLGINAPPENRVTYQKINICSPIDSTEFARVVNANETDEAYYWPPDTTLQQFFYGPITNANFSYTFEYSQSTPLDNFPYDIQ